MTTPALTFEELELIFWTSGAAKALASRRGNCYQAAFIRKAMLPDLLNIPESFYSKEYPAGSLPVPYETAQFTLMARDYGPAKFVAVMSGDWVIVPPFPIDDIPHRLSQNPFEDARA